MMKIPFDTPALSRPVPSPEVPSGSTFNLYVSNYIVLVWVSSKADLKVNIWA